MAPSLASLSELPRSRAVGAGIELRGVGDPVFARVQLQRIALDPEKFLELTTSLPFRKKMPAPAVRDQPIACSDRRARLFRLAAREIDATRRAALDHHVAGARSIGNRAVVESKEVVVAT